MDLMRLLLVPFHFGHHIQADLGTDGPTKTDEFLEKFQTAFDLPFSENYIADFATKVRDFATKVRVFILKLVFIGPR